MITYTLKAVKEDFLQQNYTTIKICINYACRELEREIKFTSSNRNQLHFIHILYLFTYTELLPGECFARFQAKGRRRCSWAATCCNKCSAHQSVPLTEWGSDTASSWKISPLKTLSLKQIILLLADECFFSFLFCSGRITILLFTRKSWSKLDTTLWKPNRKVSLLLSQSSSSAQGDRQAGRQAGR